MAINACVECKKKKKKKKILENSNHDSFVPETKGGGRR